MTAARQPAEVDAGQLQRYLEEGASISGESTGSSVEIERRVITDITTHEIKTTTYHDPETGRAIYEVTATASSGDDGTRTQIFNLPTDANLFIKFSRAPIEAEAEQYAAATRSERFEHADSAAAAAAASASAAEQQYSRSESRAGAGGGGAVRERGTREYTATRTTGQMGGGDYGEQEGGYGQEEEEVAEGVYDRTTKKIEQ
ncbi:unnamed protein product [Gongylonema pulchrum]|uniref:Uncharacterized protein n=1 Tax=Gongylonema pulchrum TaxID=637853 RepID=A0A3P6QD01_9BILA|nr:unnamed protein product [Gongylonema pulchrum]